MTKLSSFGYFTALRDLDGGDPHLNEWVSTPTKTERLFLPGVGSAHLPLKNPSNCTIMNQFFFSYLRYANSIKVLLIISKYFFYICFFYQQSLSCLK